MSAHLATVEVYDTATDTWTTETPMPTPRIVPRGALANGVIYVIGGYISGYPSATVEAATAAPTQVDTASTVTSSQNPSTYGQPVAFTTTVSPVPPATGTPTGTVQFKIDGSDFGTPVALSGGSATSGDISTLMAGDHIVTATYGGDSNFNGSTSPSFTQTVDKANQTITFGALADKTYGDADFTVSATASSGLPVSFTASGAGTVSGNTVHITGVGSCTITAQQTGDGNYNAAPDVSQTFTVNITYSGLGNLVQQFVIKTGVANSLLTKLGNAQKADANGNANAKAGMIAAFINEVEAQTGKAVSAENAAILIALANAL